MYSTPRTTGRKKCPLNWAGGVRLQLRVYSICAYIYTYICVYRYVCVCIQRR